ncbi:MAG: HAMP domain-containing histidine kinase [Chromatiales bacterium]|nr:HAMP domain-containing histidine kinase [Chromatiales bacterium]
MAHEINNPLAIIGEKAGLLKDILALDSDYPRHRQADRAGRFDHRAPWTAARRSPSGCSVSPAIWRSSVEPVNLAEIVREVLGFLHREASYRSIAVEVDVPEDLPQFVSDHGKLQQILLNLVNNAFAAMNDGGNLQIRARLENGPTIVLTVKDDGCGISEGDIERIFEPFFTTKKDKGGTGLGSVDHLRAGAGNRRHDPVSKAKSGAARHSRLPCRFATAGARTRTPCVYCWSTTKPNLSPPWRSACRCATSMPTGSAAARRPCSGSPRTATTWRYWM